MQKSVVVVAGSSGCDSNFIIRLSEAARSPREGRKEGRKEGKSAEWPFWRSRSKILTALWPRRVVVKAETRERARTRIGITHRRAFYFCM